MRKTEQAEADQRGEGADPTATIRCSCICGRRGFGTSQLPREHPDPLSRRAWLPASMGYPEGATEYSTC
jgi:hypothetical protein